MRAKRPGRSSLWNPLRAWHRMSWRWKMTLVGVAIGALSASLWTIPGAYFALSNGYMRHGIIYVVASVLGIAGMAGLMHFFGTRQERDLNGTE